MLQNRVDPFGNLIKTKARGGWMGNRGLIHNEHQEIVRPFRLKAWITCVLEFKDRKRKVMTPGLYTELFFMDEATAFAAGHRPCAECRRTDFKRFKSFWLKGNPEYGFDEKTSIANIDEILHRERMDSSGGKVMHKENSNRIPHGSFVMVNDEPYLVADGLLHLWTPAGYIKTIALPANTEFPVLTPKSVMNAFRAGYLPCRADLNNEMPA